MGVVRVLALVLCLAAPASRALAQGDGPRTYPLGPTGLNMVSATYMRMGSNFNFQQSVLLLGVDVTSDIGAVSYLRNFGIAGRFAQVQLTPIFGDVGGSGTLTSGGGQVFPLDGRGASGFADPYVSARIGLVGAPALTLPEFMKHRQSFQLYGLVGANIPIGSYDASRALNLGTNRWAIRLATPMVWPVLDPTRPLLLEFTPSLYLYTDNDEPFGASNRSQAPLFVLETHASYRVMNKVWAGADLHWQTGGETTTDDVPDDNAMAHAGVGVSVGYQVNRALTVFASYGGILLQSDGSEGTMFRVRAILVF